MLQQKQLLKNTLKDFSDMAYCIRERFKLVAGIGLQARLQKKKINGISVPAVPPVRKTVTKIRDTVWRDTPTAFTSDEEIVKHWKSGKTYLGYTHYVKLQLTSKSKEDVEALKEVPVQILDMRTQLILKVLDLTKEGKLKRNQAKLELKFADWQDGTTGLRWPLMAILINLIYDDDYCVNEDDFYDVTAPVPIVFGISRETVKAVQHLKQKEAKMLSRLHVPFIYEGTSYHFRLHLNSCDHGDEGMYKLFYLQICV